MAEEVTRNLREAHPAERTGGRRGAGRGAWVCEAANLGRVGRVELRHRWGSQVTAGYRWGWRKHRAAPLREEGAATTEKTPFREEETADVGLASVFPYPPLSDSLFVALSSDVASIFLLNDLTKEKLQLTNESLSVNPVETEGRVLSSPWIIHK